MTEKPITENELLKEARRTTHAVRAIARFVVLIVAYQLVAGLLIGLGVTSSGSDMGGVSVVIGLLLVVIGLIHSLVAAWGELEMSDRLKASSLASDSSSEGGTAHRLFDGACDCTPAERKESGTALFGDIEFCVGCSRRLADNSTLDTDPDLARDERGLLQGFCSCTKLERWANTDTKEGVKYCLRCERAVPK